MSKYRHERKFFITESDAFILQQRIKHVLRPDSFSQLGSYHISSLYFDDQYYSSFNEKLSGILVRDKFRARFYNSKLDTIFLERKHKHDNGIYKTRAAITESQYKQMQNGDYSFMQGEMGNKVFEDFYLSHVTKQMRPVAMVSYDRKAFMYEPGNVRVTFDTNITASDPTLHSTYFVLQENHVILEVKYDHFLPQVVTDMLRGISPTQQLAISKYLLAMSLLLRSC